MTWGAARSRFGCASCLLTLVVTHSTISKPSNYGPPTTGRPFWLPIEWMTKIVQLPASGYYNTYGTVTHRRGRLPQPSELGPDGIGNTAHQRCPDTKPISLARIPPGSVPSTGLNNSLRRRHLGRRHQSGSCANSLLARTLHTSGKRQSSQAFSRAFSAVAFKFPVRCTQSSRSPRSSSIYEYRTLVIGILWLSVYCHLPPWTQAPAPIHAAYSAHLSLQA